MASKRAAEFEADEAPRKRRNQRHIKSSKSHSTIDPNYGQRSIFGDLECLTTAPTGDSDLDCEDDAEAMAYLKSVR